MKIGKICKKVYFRHFQWRKSGNQYLSLFIHITQYDNFEKFSLHIPILLEIDLHFALSKIMNWRNFAYEKYSKFSVEITEISSNTFWFKSSRSNVYTKEVTKKLISRNIDLVRKNFLFFLTVTFIITFNNFFKCWVLRNISNQIFTLVSIVLLRPKYKFPSKNCIVSKLVFRKF